MIRIVSQSRRRDVAALLSAARIRDRITERKAAEIVGRVRRGGDAALLRYAKQLDDLSGSIELSRRTWEREQQAK